MNRAITEHTRVARATRIAARVINEKAVVVVIDERKLHVLNPIGTRVWALADGRTVGSIVDDVVAQFEVDRTQAIADVIAFLEELASLKAIELDGVEQ